MKICKNDPCKSTDIELGRRVCRDCKRLQMKLRATHRREQDRPGYNTKMREFRRQHPVDKVEEKARQAKKYLKFKNKIDKNNLNWRVKNKSYITSYTASQRAGFREPPWLTKEQKKQIQQIYVIRAEISKSTGIVHEVDHVIPLRNEMVSGLHVPWNLQIMPRNGSYGNRAKSNRF